MPSPPRLARPAAHEHPAGYATYYDALPGADAWPELLAQEEELRRLLGPLSEAQALHRYAPGKWSVKEVVAHVADNERVFAYRALQFARGDPTPLPNFDENLAVATAGFDTRPLHDLLAEWSAVRAASLALFGSLDEAALGRQGIARGDRVSVRALAWVTAGHHRHHLEVLRQRYGIG